eukprot:CAMPEP_0170557556 /NCGR_PEP_ID=MMETSP0211-20121228/27538_1 /TAXON_ID=311385 /ORGANISM="Pseudokeronopsis sp., Strain OXSARD2" /LENGTH=164 /DNA_ID=CAMNT_0010868699 /DNA_START=149 /DNA_END=643 /DNA_ORIENTATION=-
MTLVSIPPIPGALGRALISVMHFNLGLPLPRVLKAVILLITAMLFFMEDFSHHVLFILELQIFLLHKLYGFIISCAALPPMTPDSLLMLHLLFLRVVIYYVHRVLALISAIPFLEDGAVSIEIIDEVLGIHLTVNSIPLALIVIHNDMALLSGAKVVFLVADPS